MNDIATQQKDLHHAIAAGEIDVAVAMIAQNRALLDTAYPPDLDPKEGTPLHQAMGSDNANMMRALLELNPSQPNALDKDGKTPLAHYRSDQVRQVDDWMPFFIAVDKGCLVDTKSIRLTNETAIDILQKGFLGSKEECRKQFDDYLECLKLELSEFCDIEMLPNRNKNPKAFCGMLLTAYAADNIAWATNEGRSINGMGAIEMGAGMLELIQKQGTHWEQNLTTLCKEDMVGLSDLSQDTLSGFIRCAVLPGMVRQLGKCPAGGQFYRRPDDPLAGGITEQNYEPYPNVLFQNRSISEAIDVIKVWHENMHRIDASLREINEELLARTPNASVVAPPPEKGWTPLLPEGRSDVPSDVLAGQTLPFNAQKLVITELTDAQSLTDEGSEEKQDNCVGDYAGSCKSGKLRVFSIRTDTGHTLSTLGVNIKADGSFTQYQHYAKGNEAPHNTASRAARWLLRSLNEAAIPMNTVRAVQAKNAIKANARLEPFLEFGFVPTAEKCERAYQLVASLKTAKGKPFLSPDHRYESIAKMDEDTGIIAATAESIMNHAYDAFGEKELAQLQRRVDALKAVDGLPPP